MNFFRSLGSALLVAIMGAILLFGLGSTPQRGGTTNFAATLGGGSGDLSPVFSWVFVAAAATLACGIFCYLMMEERPLRGPVAPTTTAGKVTANPGAARPASSPTPAE
jgi:hypothetical protein